LCDAEDVNAKVEISSALCAALLILSVLFYLVFLIHIRDLLVFIKEVCVVAVKLLFTDSHSRARQAQRIQTRACRGSCVSTRGIWFLEECEIGMDAGLTPNLALLSKSVESL
jgi:hypothetical protein